MKEHLLHVAPANIAVNPVIKKRKEEWLIFVYEYLFYHVSPTYLTISLPLYKVSAGLTGASKLRISP